MQDHRDLEEDYIRRLRKAQEAGDRRHVPFIDPERVRHGRLLSTQEASEGAFKTFIRFITKEGLGGVGD